MNEEYCPNCGAVLDAAGNCPVRYAQSQYSIDRLEHDAINEEGFSDTVYHRKAG